jgi:hypothetical protein
MKVKVLFERGTITQVIKSAKPALLMRISRDSLSNVAVLGVTC